MISSVCVSVTRKCKKACVARRTHSETITITLARKQKLTTESNVLEAIQQPSSSRLCFIHVSLPASDFCSYFTDDGCCIASETFDSVVNFCFLASVIVIVSL